jgi:hypothetical protein
VLDVLQPFAYYGIWKFWESVKFGVLKSYGFKIERDIIECKKMKKNIDEEKDEFYSKV